MKSLRWRIALALAAISALATIAIGVANYRTTHDRLYAEVDRSLRVANEGAVLGAWLNGRDAPGDRRLPVRGPLGGLAAQIILADGSVLEANLEQPWVVDPESVDELVERGRESFSTEQGGETVYRVRTIGAGSAALQIGRPLTETERVLDSLRDRIAGWTLVVLVVSILAGSLIASRVTSSLRRLTLAAEQVEATGQLEVEVPESGADEVGRLGIAFNRMLAALRRSRDDQQRLVQDAGHELRTPLTSLRTNLETLERFPTIEAQDRAAILADLRAETHELTQLVNELVTVASGAQSDEPVTSVDLTAIAGEVATRFERRTGRRMLVDGDDQRVNGQRSSLQRAVSCLIDNAVKFDTTNEPIEIVVDQRTITVRDRGPGIPVADEAAVFKRFHRAEAARGLPGSGLGLAIVDEIARRHDGGVFARGRDGGGAEVGFWLGAGVEPAD